MVRGIFLSAFSAYVRAEENNSKSTKSEYCIKEGLLFKLNSDKKLFFGKS